jgi:hypothetical protein
VKAVERAGGRTGGWEKGEKREKGAKEVKIAEWAVSREEKRDETAVWQMPLRVLAFIFTCRERSFPDRFAKISFGSGVF